MSNREIIEWLKKKAEAVPMPGARKMYEAAAKALEAAQPEHGTNLASLGTDCISREQAIDALENDKAELDKIIKGMSAMDVRLDAYVSQRNQVVYDIDAIEQLQPILPAEPQIIRCKDCKNWDTTWTNDFSPNYHYCPMVDGVRKEDWFCADAERRTDG